MPQRTILTFYFIATFLQAGTYGLTFLLPLLFKDFMANERDVGAVLMATTISTLVTVLYLGHITAVMGRINAIGLASVLIAVSLFIFGQASSFGPMLFVAGAILGAGWGIFYVLTPVVLTEITSKEDRIRIFTLLSVFIMAGFGLSPVLGSTLVKAGFSIALTFTVTAVLCVVSGAIFLMLHNPIRKISNNPNASDKSDLTWTATVAVFRSRAALPILMVGIGASVFAAVTNFQTVYAEENGLDYAAYFLAYTVTVIICRVLFAEFIGGRAPYGVIALLLGVMVTSVVYLASIKDSNILYVFGAILFGVGYGVSYPIVKAMAANEAEPKYLGQTLQIFGLSYFIGVFGFPFIAGWVITTVGMSTLLFIAVVLSAIECLLALFRYLSDNRASASKTYFDKRG